MNQGPFTHSKEIAVIEASSTFRQSFIEIFVGINEFFDDPNFLMKYAFRIY